MDELVFEKNKIIQFEKYAMQPSEVREQVGLIQHIMKEVMKEKVHFGIIPGCGDKPALYQAGAEKLMLTFRLRSEFALLSSKEDDTYIGYTVQCNLYHIPTNHFVGSGIGSCNSKESKYRYRNVSLNQEVPKEYWAARNKGDTEAMQIALGGIRRFVKKSQNKWIIMDRIENDNPWDFQNTLLKMAAKRAKVASVLNATAASDIFTQDIEDLPREFIQNDIDKESDKETQISSESSTTGSASTHQSPLPKNDKQDCIFTITELAGNLYHGDIDAMQEYYKTWLKKDQKLSDLTLGKLKEIIHDLKQALKQRTIVP